MHPPHRSSDTNNNKPPVSVLLVNAIAILSEDRFLARIGWGNAQQQSEPSFGGGAGAQDNASVKAKMINLINSVRTLMRSTSYSPAYAFHRRGLLGERLAC